LGRKVHWAMTDKHFLLMLYVGAVNYIVLLAMDLLYQVLGFATLVHTHYTCESSPISTKQNKNTVHWNAGSSSRQNTSRLIWFDEKHYNYHSYVFDFIHCNFEPIRKKSRKWREFIGQWHEQFERGQRERLQKTGRFLFFGNPNMVMTSTGNLVSVNPVNLNLEMTKLICSVIE